MVQISLVICTHNRDSLLEKCISSIVNLNSDLSLVEVVVVDNYGKSNTKKLISQFREKNQISIQYCYESNIGLSFARNTGVKNAQNEWLVFIDDDSLIDFSYLYNLNQIIADNLHLRCIGGKYLPWYLFGKPRWYNDEWASSSGKPSSFSELKSDQYFDGGNFVIHRSIFSEIGLFNTSLGMSGQKISYGEEIDFQVRMRLNGIPIWYSPNLLILHLVPKYKLKVSWFIKSWYAHGKDYWNTYNVRPFGYGVGFGVFLRVTKLILFNFLMYSKKLNAKNYFIQNWIIDSLKLPAWEIGRLVGAKKLKFNVRN